MKNIEYAIKVRKGTRFSNILMHIYFDGNIFFHIIFFLFLCQIDKINDKEKNLSQTQNHMITTNSKRVKKLEMRLTFTKRKD
jgi:hypothetical protein